MLRSLVLTLGLLFVAAFPAQAQYQVPAGSIPVGKGPGFTSFNTVTGSSGAGAKCLIDTNPPTFGTCPGGGGGGTPGGLNLQIQYNNAGAFGGLTDPQVTARIQAFTNVLSGAAPASGGGTVNFLRADGTWAVPPGTPGSMTVGTSTISSGTTMGVLFNNGGVLGNTAAGTLDFHLTGNGASAPTFKGYLRVATNAVTRTWQAKAADIFNVLDFATPQDAVNAAIANNGGTVRFPCQNYSLGVGAIGLDLTNARNVRLIGDMPVNAGGSTCGSLVYSGTGIAIKADGTVGFEFGGLRMDATSASVCIQIAGTGAQAAFPSIHDSSIFCKNTATGIAINLANVIGAEVYRTYIFGYVGIRGLNSGAGAATDVSNRVTISSNTFDASNTFHMQNAAGWLVQGNIFETGRAYSQSAGIGNCYSINFVSNFFSDPVGTNPWIDTDCLNIKMSGNVFGTAAGGDVVHLTGSGQLLTSINDQFEGTFANGFSIGSGVNWIEVLQPKIGVQGTGWTTMVSGTPATGVSHYQYGATNHTGTLTMGLAGTNVGRIDFLGSTSGTASVRAQATAGTPTILLPTNSGTLAGTATAPITVNATTGDIGCTTCLTTTGAQTVQNKTLDNTNVATLRDDRFTLQDDVDNTKQAVFQLSGITTATTRTYTVPNVSSTLAVLGLAQTFTAQQTFGANIAVTGTNVTTFNQNNISRIQLSNSDAGNAAQATFLASNGTNSIEFGQRGTGQTAYGALLANVSFIYGATDFVTMSDGGKVVFASGGSAEAGRFATDRSFLVGRTTNAGAGTIWGAGSFGTAAPSTKTGSYSHALGDSSLIFNAAGSSTLTLLAAATYPGLELMVKTIAAQTVVSASSNVVPKTGGAAGTAILPATAGAWALLKSDGTNWLIWATGT